MWTDIENKIRNILDTIDFLNPIAARVIVNRNAGHPEAEDLRLYSIGKTGTAVEGVDSRFYGIMQTQRFIRIPSIRQSALLSHLPFGEGSAVFFTINSRYGYCGFVWACFPADQFSDKIVDSFVGCCEWLEMVIQRWLEEELGMQNQANHYVDLMERLNIPAVLLMLPDRLLFSNPSFENMKEKESFVAALRQDADKSPEGGSKLSDFDYVLKKFEFATGQRARIYIFPHAGGDVREIRFGENEIQYYRMLTQKALGTLALLESSEDMTDLQKNYIDRTDSPLKRLEALYGYGERHYQKTEKSNISVEVISVTELARDVMFDLASAGRNKRVEILLETDPGTAGNSSGNAVGDPWLLTLAIYDLLDNAIHFTPMDGKPISIRISYGEHEWSLRVEDFGTGISPLDLERIRNLNYVEAAGSGLHGIALVKYVAKAHNGRLDIESRLGKGSVFTLTIPYY